MTFVGPKKLLDTVIEHRRRESLDIIGRERMQMQQTPMHAHHLLESRQERHNCMRKLSSTETVYPSPDAAKQALQSQRAANPNHHRAPNPPYISTHSFARTDDPKNIVQPIYPLKSFFQFHQVARKSKDTPFKSRI